MPRIQRFTCFLLCLLVVGTASCVSDDPNAPMELTDEEVRLVEETLQLIKIRLEMTRDPAAAEAMRAGTGNLYSDEEREILLERRPPSGIWGGLWSLPECSEEEPIEEWCRRNLNAETELDEMWPEFRHGFSHYHLHITPILLTLKGPPQGVMEALGRTWYNPRSPDERGLAAPIRSILESLANSS